VRFPPRTLLLFTALISGQSFPTAAGAQTLAGWVSDQANGTPVVLARVTLLDLDSIPTVYTLTDADGHFRVTAPETGDYRVSAESGFYWRHSDGPVSLSTGDTLWVRFTLLPRPVEMDELVVEAGRRYRRMVLGGYYDRKEKGFGWHIDRERIERFANSRISTVLRGVPGLTVPTDRYGDREPVLGGWRSLHRGIPGSPCFPRVYVDGMLLSPGGGVPSNIDRVVSPEEVEGIEVFISPWVPAGFGGNTVECGVIAVWRR